MSASMFELKNDPQYDKSALSKLTKDSIDNNTNLYKQAVSISDNTNWLCENLMFNFSVNIYHHFTIFNGKKYLITTNIDRNMILRMKEIEPVLKEEKENPALIPRPFAFYFYKPER
jgi:hypothetical protein